MGGIIENYFKDIYTTSNASSFDEILSGIHLAIFEEDAGLLGCDFHASEVSWLLIKWLLLLYLDLMVCPIFFTSLFGILWVEM